MRSSPPPTLQITAMVLLSAVLFVEIYRFNTWIFGALEHTPGVNWVFLPAGFRVLLVLGMGLPGAVGILLGNLWLDHEALSVETLPSVLAIGLASGFGPWLVKRFMEQRGLLQHDLRHITANRLLQFVLLYAGFNALAHQLIRAAFHTPNAEPWVDIWPMFIGDAIGALVVLYGVKLLLAVLRPWLRPPLR